MKNNRALIIIIVIVVGAVLLLAWLGSSPQLKRFTWYPEFREDGLDPYDMKVLYSILNKQYNLNLIDEPKRLNQVLPTDESAKGTGYVFFNSIAFYTEEETDHLLDYVKSGGNAFISTSSGIPDTLAQSLIMIEDCDYLDIWRGNYSSVYEEKITSTFMHPELSREKHEFYYVRNYEIVPNQWSYINSKNICDDARYPLAALGYIETVRGNFPNFVRAKVGEGYFYFHTNPILFTNLYTSRENGFYYIQKVFAHIDADKLYWDKSSKLRKEWDPNSFIKPDSNFRPTRSPLEYIRSEPTLVWAWYVLLSTGLLYVLFRAKRKQRIIPVIAPNRNTSLEFVNTISSLYFQQQDHKNIFRKQMQLFLSHLRNRYNLVTRDLDDRLIQKIITRSEVNPETVQTIFTEYKRVEKHLDDPYVEVASKTLVNFYLMIEKFHREVAENEKKYN